MDDPGFAETEHEIDIALVGAGLARDEGGVSVELDAGKRDRGFVLRRRDDRSTAPASAASIAARAKASAARPARRVIGAEGGCGRCGCGQSRTLTRSSDHCASAICVTTLRSVLMPQAVACRSNRSGIAHHNRVAGLAHLGIERGLEADLRADARRVAGRNGDFRFAFI